MVFLNSARTSFLYFSRLVLMLLTLEIAVLADSCAFPAASFASSMSPVYASTHFSPSQYLRTLFTVSYQSLVLSSGGVSDFIAPSVPSLPSSPYISTTGNLPDYYFLFEIPCYRQIRCNIFHSGCRTSHFHWHHRQI